MDTVFGNVFLPGQKSRLCVLRVEHDTLLATPREAGEGVEPVRFPLREECLSFGGDAGSQLVLKNPEGATLYAERAALQPLLERRGDRAFQEKLRSEHRRVVKAGRLSLLALLGFVLFCGASIGLLLLGLNWGVDRAVDRIPIAWEEKLGDMVVESGMGPEIIDPRIVDPVQSVIDRIAAAEPEQPYTLKLHVVENPQVNAFAAPGGHIVVYTGLLEKAENPEELAGVLAHEFQHVFRRHGLRKMVHAVKWQVVGALVLGDVSTVQHVLLAKAPDFMTLSYGRSLEEEADLEGAELLVRAGVDPNGMVRFFEILQEQESLKIPEVLSSHPDTAHRIEELREWIDTQPETSHRPLEVNWAALQEALAE